jgi:hypothetical protein
MVALKDLPSFHMIQKVSFRVQHVDVGGPENAEFLHQVLRLIDVDLHGNEKVVQGGGDTNIGVRHGTQLRAAPSAFLEEIQKDGFRFLFGPFQGLFARILPLNPGFLKFHCSSPPVKVFSFHYVGWCGKRGQ